jgi:hypothetical protein
VPCQHSLLRNSHRTVHIWPQGTTEHLTGLLHPTIGGECVTPQTIIPVTGFVGAEDVLTLTSGDFANGSVLKVTALVGTNNELSKVSYSVVGGSCAFANATTKASTATITQMASVSGTYQGTFSDTAGYSLPVTAILTQTTQPDANGMYHVSGNANFAGNSTCITSAVVTDSTVTGNTLSTTYTQQSNSIVATGTFDSTATELTITGWTLSGPCGPDQGTGVLEK